MPNGTWIVVPAFNEANVIADVVADVRVRHPEVVVVDDCSEDGTGLAAMAAGAVVLRHPVNLGQGAALQTGIRYALEQGADYIVTFDSDGQHRAQDIDVLLARQRETGADVVIGSRFLGSAVGLPPLRRLMLKAATLFTRLSTGIPVSDAHNGLRLFTRRAAKEMRIRQNRMAHASEIIDQLGALKLKVAEAPVTIVYTEYSLRKGQKLSNSISILVELIVARLSR
jgi:glycosyltransferase involved in cell wall biosynthesis